MNAINAPEWTHHCYWLNVVQNCEYDTVHRNIVIFSLCAHLIPLFIGTHALWLRCRHLWRGMYCRIRGHIVPSTVECLLVTWTLESYARVAFLLVTLLDAWPNQVWKEVVFSVTLFPFMYGILLFLCGLVAAIPPSLTYTHHVNADGTDSFRWSFSHWSKMPQRLSGAGVYVPSIATLQVFTVTMILVLPSTIIPFSIMNGFAWEDRDWNGLLYWRRVEFLTWGVYVFIIFFITVYYSRGLSAIMRGSFQSPESENDHERNDFTSVDHSLERGHTRTTRTTHHRHSYPLEESFVEPEDRPRGPLAFVQNRLNLRHSNSNHAAMSAATRVEHIFTMLHITTGITTVFAVVWALINQVIVSNPAVNITLNIGMNGIVLPLTLGFTLWKLQQSTLATLKTQLSAVYGGTKNALHRVRNAVRYPHHVISEDDGKGNGEMNEVGDAFRKQPFEVNETDGTRYNFLRQPEEYVWATSAAEEQLNQANRSPSTPPRTKLFKRASNEDINEFSSSWRLQASFHTNTRDQHYYHYHTLSSNNNNNNNNNNNIDDYSVPRIHHHNLSLQPAWRGSSDTSVKGSWIDVKGYYRNNVDTSSHSIPQGKHANMEELDAFGPNHDFYTSLPRPQSPDPYDRGPINGLASANHSHAHHTSNNSNSSSSNSSNNSSSSSSNATSSGWWTVDRQIITTPSIGNDDFSDDQQSTLYSNPFPEI